MSAFKPPGWPTVIPRLFCADPEGLVAFVRTVFDARGDYHDNRPAEMRFGDDAIVMISSDRERSAMAGCLYVYVPDADATFEQARRAGVEVIEAPLDTPYGDRRAMVRDRWGNVWQIAHVLGEARS